MPSLFLMSLLLPIAIVAASFANKLEIISKPMVLQIPKSDCSNTFQLKEDDPKSPAKTLTYMHSSSHLAEVDYEVWLDVDMKEEDVKDVTGKIQLQSCNKGKEVESKKDDKNPGFGRSIQKQCTNQKSSGSKWHVLLYRTDENMIFCQGALIDTNWVLTIAHCLVGYDGSIMKPNIINVMIKGSNKHLKVTKIHTHESFKYATFSYDVALLKIAPPSQPVTPICLPSAAIAHTQTLTGVWWEGDSWDISYPGEFFKGNTKSVGISDCKKKIQQSAASYSFDNMQVCSENPDYCAGDMWQRMSIASPLIVKRRATETLVGLKSWGSTSFSCDAGSETQVHIDVFKYHDWISEKLIT